MFTIEQTYDLASLTALCRAARLTQRRVWRVIRCILWIILVLGACLWVAAALPDGSADFWMAAAVLVLLLLLLLEDRLNAWVALRQMVPGTARSVTVFSDDAYTVTADMLETRYQYENITALAESGGCFFLFLGKKHGQIFDKRGFRQGDPDAFRVWLEEKTGKAFQKIK